MKLRSVLGLITIIALVFVATEYKSGQLLWEETEAKFLADGESLEVSIRYSNPVPDEKNFASIPELFGITTNDEAGDLIRADLELIGLRKAGVRWPKYRGKLRRPWMPRQKADLKILHDYLYLSGILDVSKTPSNIAHDLMKAMDEAHGQTIKSMNAANSRDHSEFLPRAGTLTTSPVMMLEEAPNLRTAQTIARGLGVYALLASRTNQGELSASTIETMFRLSEATQSNPSTLLAHQVAIAIRSMAINPIWDSLQARIWTDRELDAIQKTIATIEPRQALVKAFRSETIAYLQFLELTGSDPDVLNGSLGRTKISRRTTWPIRPWLNFNRAYTLDFSHSVLIQPLKQTRRYSEIFKHAMEETDNEAADSWMNPRKMLAGLSNLALASAIRKTAIHETELIQAATACALERYYLAHNSYPETLQILVPKFLSVAPVDPMNNEPMLYQRTNDGRYQLHSVGIDGKDNDGGEGETSYLGDITWNYKKP